MSEEIEFGTKAAADEAREEWADYVCPVDDDRRTKTVAFVSDAPDGVLDMAEARALESKGERTRSVTANLSERERERISDLGGFDQTTTTMSWESAKGVFAREGLTDQFWDAIGSLTDHDDPAVGAEEYVARYQEGGGSGGARDHGAEGVQERRVAAEQARAAQGEQCDHAADHCRHGDPDACEFLRDACGYDEQTVDQMLSGDTRGDDTTEQQTLTGEQKGALQRAWGGYKAAISQLDRLVTDLRKHKANAQQAFAAINRIREQADQEPLDPQRLHELLEATRQLPDATTLDEFASSGDTSGNSAVLEIEESAQADLSGEQKRTEQQAEFDIDEDVRQAQGRDSREAVERNEGGLMADTRSEEAVGQDSEDSGEQQQFRDPEQGTL